ncbi:hypothetical protein [Streptomyces sp. NPDC093060]|uniref:hypothetical protein n=1 Tax=Streptomyces sp. NPDC093060 TaxID=3366019 RepID=UPI003821C310
MLVPCGRLGIVPWHAARLPAGAPRDHVCQIMVISYAASGRQFLDAVRRARRTLASDPVLVADPTMTLTHAELEVTALHRAPPGLLPADAAVRRPVRAARRTGSARHAGRPSRRALRQPVPAPRGLHGSAGTSPTESALQLARPVDPAGPPPDRPGRPDPGRLTWPVCSTARRSNRTPPRGRWSC